jgi:hypothetical protein
MSILVSQTLWNIDEMQQTQEFSIESNEGREEDPNQRILYAHIYHLITFSHKPLVLRLWT